MVKKRFKASQRGGIDAVFLVLVLAILVIGLIMLFSASYADALYREGNSLYYITRQLGFAIGGVIAMLFISRFDYHILHRFALPLLLVTVVLLALCYTQPAINGCRRWIFIPHVTSFQPSELAKFSLVLIFSHLISVNYSKMKTFSSGVLPFILVLAVICSLVLFETHLSCTILLLLIGLIMMFVGGTKLVWFGVGGAGVIGALGYAVISGKISYAMNRINIWLDPFADAQGLGFQNVQSLYAISSGGFLGLGLGNSRQKYLYIPEPQNDFIFAIVCEELGYIGAALIIVLFGLLVWRGFSLSMKSCDKFGSMLVLGIILQVGLQVVLNVAVVANVIPNTGISLPFFSYGGTSLFMLLAEMGVVLSVSRQTVSEKA